MSSRCYWAPSLPTHNKSINKQLVHYASQLLDKVQVEILDLNDYELPLYSQDKEDELGHPQLAKDFLDKIGVRGTN